MGLGAYGKVCINLVDLVGNPGWSEMLGRSESASEVLEVE